MSLATTTMGVGGVPLLQELKPDNPATYDMRTGLYTIERKWQCATDWMDALFINLPSSGPVKLVPPDTFTLFHTDNESGYVFPVTMIRVTHKSEYLRAAADFNPPQSILTIAYEGHVCRYPPNAMGGKTTVGVISPGGGITGIPGTMGIVSSHYEHGTKSEQILISYDVVPSGPNPDAGKRLAIGDPSTAQGTNRIVPQVRWVITQNLTEEDYYIQVPIINLLIGTLNNDGWSDPTWNANGTIPAPTNFPAGAWLYLGPEVTKNRDGTYTLQHKFDFDGIVVPWSLFSTTPGYPFQSAYPSGAPESHRYEWYFLNQDKKQIPPGPEGGLPIWKIYKKPIGDPQLSTIYLAAGNSADNGPLAPPVISSNILYHGRYITFNDLFALTVS